MNILKWNEIILELYQQEATTNSTMEESSHAIIVSGSSYKQIWIHNKLVKTGKSFS